MQIPDYSSSRITHLQILLYTVTLYAMQCITSQDAFPNASAMLHLSSHLFQPFQ